jgi:alpha-galactosidase
MSTPAALATHARGGRVEPTRIGVRLAGGGGAGPDAASPPVSAEAPFALGEQRLGDLAIEVRAEHDTDAATVGARVRNGSDRELHLASVLFGFRWSGHAARSFRFLRHGWQSWSFTGVRDLDAAGEPEFPSGPWLRGMHHAVSAPASDRQGWHESDLVTAIGAAPEGPACVVGVLERGRAFGVVYARRSGDAVEIEVEQLLEAALAPGEARELEAVRVALGPDASRLLEAFAEAHARRAEARAAHPFVTGWCSWYHYFADVDEDVVLRNLEALVAAKGELPVDVVQIDDGYQRATGDWLRTNEKFPRGIAPLAQEIRAAGFTAGIWTAPFCAVAESDLFSKHRDWMLRDRGDPFRGLVHPQWSADGSVYVLDTARDDVLSHLENLFRDLVAMGFHYLKLDFLYTAAMYADSRDRGQSRAQRLRRGLDAVRSGAGSDAFLLGCGCPLGAAVGVVDGMRIGPDVAPTWLPDPAHAIPGIEETVPSTRNAVRNVLSRTWMHRRLWLNDPDCLMARRRDTDLSAAETRTLAAAIAATGGMVVFSDDLTALSRGDRAFIHEAAATAKAVDGAGIPGRARVLDLLAPSAAARVASLDAEGGVVALVNASEERDREGIDLEELRIDPVSPGPEALLGSREPRGETRRRIDVDLAAHESALFRLRRRFPLAVFCDFDGTFAVQDVGSTLVRRHVADLRPALWERYARGEITAWDYNLEIFANLDLPRADVDAFLRTVELDPGARELVAWCERREVPFRVLSDGFDYNLNRLQVIHGVRFAYEANRLRIEDGRWLIEVGRENPDCFCGTGVCKRLCIEAFRRDHPAVTAVHIGNGRVSDTCGAMAADVVFAKDSLADELARREVCFESFTTLRDVIPTLERLLVERRSA